MCHRIQWAQLSVNRTTFLRSIVLRISVPYARIWWPSSQGSSSPLELESADPRSFLTSADVWSGAVTGKGGETGNWQKKSHSACRMSIWLMVRRLSSYCYRMGAGQESMASPVSLWWQALSDRRSGRDDSLEAGEAAWLTIFAMAPGDDTVIESCTSWLHDANGKLIFVQ